MTNAEFYLAPKLVTIRFALAPALNTIYSMMLVLKAGQLSSLDEWTLQTAAQIPPEQRHKNRLVLEGCHALLLDEAEDWSDFVAFVNHLASQDPVALRDKIVAAPYDACAKDPELRAHLGGPLPEPAELLADVNVFIQLVTALDEDEDIDLGYLRELHALYNDPPALQSLIVSRLHALWADFFRQEWQRAEATLKGTIAAFQNLDFSHVTARDAVRIVTGREIPTTWEEKLTQIDQLTFIPSTHIGPYLSFMQHDEDQWLFFGAHLPAQVAPSTLSRSEILVRLNALADDTRLRILELLTQDAELSAQDIMTRLDLSQSSTSRHLSQLAGIGLILERRRDIAKWYSLNPERIEDTLHALSRFLKKR